MDATGFSPTHLPAFFAFEKTVCRTLRSLLTLAAETPGESAVCSNWSICGQPIAERGRAPIGVENTCLPSRSCSQLARLRAAMLEPPRAEFGERARNRLAPSLVDPSLRNGPTLVLDRVAHAAILLVGYFGFFEPARPAALFVINCR